VFFVNSEEEFAICPNCGKLLMYHSRVTRPLKNYRGKKRVYSIRVLKCVNESCPTTYHRELPDIIIPYKRFDAKTIEDALSQRKPIIEVAAEESTIWRWRKWFKLNAINIVMALISVLAIINGDVETSSLAIQKQDIKTSIETIKKIVARKKKWLNETVRILVNSSKWTFNRSAFLSG